MLKGLIDWIDERIKIRELWNDFADRPSRAVELVLCARRVAALYFFPADAHGHFSRLVLRPTPDHAYASVKFIEEVAPFGSFVRGLHHWGASFMMVLVGLHMIRVFVFGSYKKPREIIWVLGVGSSPSSAFCLHRVPAPLGPEGILATVVGTNVAGTVPVVGGVLLRIVRGGTELGAFSLSRFFAIHTYILPWSLALLAGLHVFLLERAGAGGIWNAADRVPYKAEPLFPNQIFKDTIFIGMVFIALAVMAVLFPATLEPQADPTDSTYNPRPEWYFYFVFQMLKIFEGKLELLGTVILPNLGAAALLLVPFLDRSPERNPQNGNV